MVVVISDIQFSHACNLRCLIKIPRPCNSAEQLATLLCATAFMHLMCGCQQCFMIGIACDLHMLLQFLCCQAKLHLGKSDANNAGHNIPTYCNGCCEFVICNWPMLLRLACGAAGPTAQATPPRAKAAFMQHLVWLSNVFSCPTMSFLMQRFV